MVLIILIVQLYEVIIDGFTRLAAVARRPALTIQSRLSSGLQASPSAMQRLFVPFLHNKMVFRAIKESLRGGLSQAEHYWR